MAKQKPKSKSLKRFLAGFLIGVIVTAITGVLSFWDPFNLWHLKLANSLYTRNEPSGQIVIVAIDDNSRAPKELGGLGNFKKWPRNNFTQLLRVMKTEGAKTVVLDVNFDSKSSGLSDQAINDLILKSQNVASPDQKAQILSTELEEYSADTMHPDDLALVQEINNFENVILYSSTNIENPEEEHKFKASSATVPSALLDIDPSLKDRVGLMKGEIDDDNVIRRLKNGVTVEDPLFNEGKPKFIEHATLATVRKYLGGPVIDKSPQIDNNNYHLETKEKGPIEIPLQEGKFLINYFAKPYSYKMVSFVDVLNEDFEKGIFKDKIVLVGATAKILHDLSFTPNSTETQMPNIEVQANAIQTVLEGKFLQNQSKFSQILTIAAISIIGAIILTFLNIWFGIAFAVILVLAYTGTAHASYYNGSIPNMVYPYFGILFMYIGSLSFKYFDELKKKQYIKRAFSRYLSPNVMNEVLKDPHMLHRGGMKREITIFFSDIVGFTSVSEKLDPHNLLELINDYLSTMTDIVLKHEGTLDKYVGDAIIAYFGAPIEQKDHALKACRVALEMREILPKLHEKWKKENKPLMDFRIGINTGDAIVGNVGSKIRFDYTIMGDEVNLGSRLEGANKKYGTNIMISESTYEQIKDNFIVRKLDYIRVKGKDKPVRVFELLSRKDELPEEGKKLLELYNRGITLYLARRFKEAYLAFKEALEIYPDDGPSKMYLQRCDVLNDFPPPDDWDGVFTMKTK